jgi:hypothetical protein
MKTFTEEQKWAILDTAAGEPNEYLGPVVFLDRILAAVDAMQVSEDTNFDDHCIDKFANFMKIKMAVCREQKGRGGWESAQPEELVRQLRVAIDKGDPVDVANYCMMLFTLGELITVPMASPTTPNVPPVAMTDDELRALWRNAGGRFHGPNIETGTMPESQLLPLLRKLATPPIP